MLDPIAGVVDSNQAGALHGFVVSQSSQQLATQRRRARQLTETAYALAALGALAFAALLNHTTLAAPLTEEARHVITWAFVGLAAADAALLLAWQHVVRWLCTRH